MITRRRVFWIVGSILLLGVAFLMFRGAGPARMGVSPSGLQFGYRTNAGRAQAVISFIVSNTGLATVRFDIPWLEYRTPSGPSFASRKLVLLGASGRAILLTPTSTTNVVIALEDEQPHGPGPLFCCQVRWFEDTRDAQLRGGPIDKAMYWLGALLGFNWSSPWSRTHAAFGDAFVSNLDVTEYFSRTWGLTRGRLVEEQRRAQTIEVQKRKELARIQATLPPNETVRYAVGNPNQLTDQERAELDAKAAFEQFLRLRTNNAVSHDPNGSADAGQPSNAGTNRTGTAGLHR